MSSELHSRLLHSNWKFRSSRLNIPFPSSKLRSLTQLMLWDVRRHMVLTAGRNTAGGAAQTPQAQLCLCFRSNFGTKTNL